MRCEHGGRHACCREEGKAFWKNGEAHRAAECGDDRDKPWNGISLFHKHSFTAQNNAGTMPSTRTKSKKGGQVNTVLRSVEWFTPHSVCVRVHVCMCTHLPGLCVCVVFVGPAGVGRPTVARLGGSRMPQLV